MTKFVVTTYAPMPKSEYRVRIHGDTVPTIETTHEVEAATAGDAIKLFPAFMGVDMTSKSGFISDAHSQIDPRTGFAGVYAKLA